MLKANGIESYVVDPASIATSRRRRRAKTDRLDGEALVRALLAFKRGEPRVCAMVNAPSPEEEDRRRICRERKVLIADRVKHVNRIKGLLFGQGVSGYEPLRKDRRTRLDQLQTGYGRPLPAHLKAQVSRELDRLELLLGQITTVEKERDTLLAAQRDSAVATLTPAAAMLCDIKGVNRLGMLTPYRRPILALTHIWCDLSCRADQAGLKQIKLSAAVHLTLHELELGNLPLSLSVGPR